MRAKLMIVSVSALLAACASDGPVIGAPTPSYLGISPTNAADAAFGAAADYRISPSKVLSANVFERITGHEVDPARLIDR
ncbi:MAG: hypothetical protein NW216_03490 [Hyphomicrobium sp.]|nr:hypothetical protein [Hyphomicrobium sp.]